MLNPNQTAKLTTMSVVLIISTLNACAPSKQPTNPHQSLAFNHDHSNYHKFNNPEDQTQPQPATQHVNQASTKSNIVTPLKTNSLDPLESLNRGIYKFNKTLDALYINPINQIYITIVPSTLKNLIGNFLNNISEIPIIINSLLQSKFAQARNSTSRFILNTTLGVGGLFDVASTANLTYTKEDFGSTLFNFGYTNSTFIMLPIIGPSTIRDSIGLIGNNFISIPYYLKPKWRNRYQITYIIHRRANLEQIKSLLEATGMDEYIMLRDAYLQNKNYQLQNTNSTESINLEAPPE